MWTIVPPMSAGGCTPGRTSSATDAVTQRDRGTPAQEPLAGCEPIARDDLANPQRDSLAWP